MSWVYLPQLQILDYNKSIFENTLDPRIPTAKSHWTYLQSLMTNRSHIYWSEHKDQNDVKKKTKCEITFLF